MWSLKRQLGNKGEDCACMFLMKQGFSIIDRNYLRSCGEIDIVAEKDNIYHFVEVKSVTRETLDEKWYRAEDNVHTYKLERLARTIAIYWEEKRLGDLEWQMDLVIVVLDKKGKIVKVELLENITGECGDI